MWLNSYYVSLKALIMFIHVLFSVTAVPVVILIKPTFLSFVKYVQYKCVGCSGQICYWKQRFVIYISFMMYLDHLTSCYLLHMDNLYLPEISMSLLHWAKVISVACPFLDLGDLEMPTQLTLPFTVLSQEANGMHKHMHRPTVYIIHYTYQFHAFFLQVLSRHTGTSSHICITVETIDSAFVYCLVVLRFLFQRILHFNTFEADTNPRFLHFRSFFLSTNNRAGNGWTQDFSTYSILLQTMSREGRQYQSNEWRLNDVSTNMHWPTFY
jgi:hypothetical protein